MNSDCLAVSVDACFVFAANAYREVGTELCVNAEVLVEVIAKTCVDGYFEVVHGVLDSAIVIIVIASHNDRCLAAFHGPVKAGSDVGAVGVGQHIIQAESHGCTGFRTVLVVLEFRHVHAEDSHVGESFFGLVVECHNVVADHCQSKKQIEKTFHSEMYLC